jgi:leader peptidase (prepilin peptidase)/N-methyltransferase
MGSIDAGLDRTSDLAASPAAPSTERSRTARLCRMPIWRAFRRQWPRVMALVIAVVAAMVSMMLVPGVNGMVGAALALLMMAIAATDARSYIIPDELTAIGLALAFLHAGLQSPDAMMAGLMLAAGRGTILAAAFWALRAAYRWLRGRDGLGLGDVKLAGVAGSWLGWGTMPIVIEIAALAGLALYAVRQYGLGRPLRATGRLPFGAFFAPAIWFGWLLEIVLLTPS